MNECKYRTKAEILTRGQEAVGIPLREIDKTGRLKTGKGAVGTVLEESWFGIKVNNEATPDFKEAGVELKATPYNKTATGIRAKERLVCNIIDYMKEYENTFQTSSFWTKCNTMLIMSYEHRPNVEKGDYTVDAAVLFSFPKDDLIIIEQDWKKIVQKVRDGRAHEISEGDTLYLGACTKGATAASVRPQPFSSIPAKQRAYSLKQSYMTYILNTYIYGTQLDENVIKDPAELDSMSFEQILTEKTKPYIGMKMKDLKELFFVDSKAKNVHEMILPRMLGVRGKLSKTAEFQKANIIPKTIRVNQDGSITESMSFPAFDFKEVATGIWEESDFKNLLEQTKFLFMIFKRNADDKLVFEGIRFWNIPECDLEEVKLVWEKTSQIIREGVKFRCVGAKIFNNLPTARENRVSHVRPHAAKSAYRFDGVIRGDIKDANELSNGQWMTKQCFWLNNTYIQEQLERHGDTDYL